MIQLITTHAILIIACLTALSTILLVAVVYLYKKNHKFENHLLQMLEGLDRFDMFSGSERAKTRSVVEHDITRISESVAKHNPLTGLYNRQYLTVLIEQEIELAEKNNHVLGVFVFGLDSFKNVNETVGPSVGDLLLRKVGKRLLEYTTEKEAKVAHLGGDEFAWIIRIKDTGSKIFEFHAEKLLQVISEPYRIENNELFVTASMGITNYPEHAKSTEDILKTAHRALHQAKNLGRNNFCFYTPELQIKTIEYAGLIEDLRKAIQSNELVLYYHPKVSFQTGCIRGSEALVRWEHPTRGMVSPEIFVSIAEETGLMRDIGDWIIQQACNDTVYLHQAGYDQLAVAINLSSTQFDTGDVANVIAKEIWQTKIDPECVEIELTESIIMSNPEKSALMLRALQAMHVSLAIDDFGTGYSSLSQLRYFPVNTLKIDQSFVRNLHKDPDNQAIIASIVTMGKRLGLKIVAEGVECADEYSILKKEGVDLMQGYFYSKPVPIKEYEALLAKNYHTSYPFD